MKQSKNLQWICRLTIVGIVLLSLQPMNLLAYAPGVHLQAAEQNTLAPQVDHAQGDDLSGYHLDPLVTSSQEGGQSGQSYAAQNPAQALSLVFTPDALTVRAATSGDVPWNLGLLLAGYGRANSALNEVTTTAAATVIENRINYAYNGISEWYINQPAGLKHGFTLTQPPLVAAGAVQIALQVQGTLKPQMSVDGVAVNLVTPSGATLLRYDSLVVFDANGATLPSALSVVGNQVIITLDDSNAAYPITVDPILTNYLVKQVAQDGAADDFLGYDVNVSEDIAIVGAYGDDNEKGVDVGTVYLYAQDKGGFNQWGELVRLVASDGQAGDQFGKDVYVHFGVTVTVGAPGNDGLGDGAGAAYLFAQNQGGPDAWGQVTKFTADNGAAGDGFGSAVSTQSNTTVIGAPGSDVNGTDAGAVYVYEPADLNNPTTWTQTKMLTAPNGAAGDRFGAAIVNSGDYIIVGAPGDDEACPENSDCDSGAVYIFERNIDGPNQWGLLHKRIADDASASALFGSSINFSADRIIVGAPGDDQMASNAGAAYIFDRDLGGDNQWQQRPKITAPDAAANDQFGRSVGIGGNIAMIGAPFDDDNGENSGSAYLVLFRGFSGQGKWGQTIKVIASDGAAGDNFGNSVDQRSGDIVIGSPKAGTTGAAYFYTSPFVMGTLQIGNNVEPNNQATNWNYTVSGPLSDAQSLTGDTQSLPALVYPGTYAITETAGANTDASLYSTKWSCTVNGSAGPSGTGSTLSVAIDALANVACTFTHLLPGTITIEKQTKPDGGTGFSFTDTIQTPNSFTLDDNGTKTFTGVAPGVYQVTEAEQADWRLTQLICTDADGGSSASGTTANIDMDAGEAITCVFTNKTKDGITILAEADTTIAQVGQTITVNYTVINDSPDDLTGVTATDDKFGSITLGATTLAPNGQTTGSIQYVVQESDLPGPLATTTTATGTPPAGPAVSDNTSISIALVGNASINVEVTAEPTTAQVGDSVVYRYQVTNNGAAALEGIVVNDNRLGTVTLTDDSLQPGESASGTLRYTVSDEDLPGPIVNTITATGQPPVGDPVTDSATVTVNLLGEIALQTSIKPSPTTASVGDTILYTYQITNTGQVSVSDLVATDNKLGAVSLTKTLLAPGESTSGTLSYTVLESDLPGPLVNTISVNGQAGDGRSVQSDATASVSLQGEDPEFSIETTIRTNATLVGVGDTITYTYQITNTGQTSISKLVATDNKLGDVPLAKTVLAPGESTSGTRTYTVMESDLPGPLVNTVVVTGEPGDGLSVQGEATSSVSLRAADATELRLPTIKR